MKIKSIPFDEAKPYHVSHVNFLGVSLRQLQTLQISARKQLEHQRAKLEAMREKEPERLCGISNLEKDIADLEDFLNLNNMN